MRMHNSRVTAGDSKKRKWAAGISNVTIPPIIAVFTFSLINYALLRGFPFVAVTFITTLFAAIVPLSILLIWEMKTNATFDLDIPARTIGTVLCSSPLHHTSSEPSCWLPCTHRCLRPL
jgi:hypothetical protein